MRGENIMDENDNRKILEREWERAAENPFPRYNHIELVRVERDDVELAVDLVPESMNFAGTVHGGLYFTMADFCAATTARTDGRRYVTQSAQVHYLKTVREGRIAACSKVIHRGKNTCLVEVEIRSEEDELLFKAAVTMFCLGMSKD